ncbi:MAG: VTT domain-containing protein [Erysipelotrichales bacterium]|nr:VTT domain-containing protein [Erysipelotrichales bacterium]
MKRKEVSKEKIIAVIIGVLALIGLIFYLLSGNNIELFKSLFREGITKQEIREIAQQFGVRGVLFVGFASMLQVIFMFLPAEPVQVIAGVSYGLWYGILICIIGVFVGNTIIYICYKIFGTKMHDYYSRKVNIDFDNAKTVRSITLIVLILYLLPAIPYGMICFFAASMGLKYHRYIILTILGALPSVLIGVSLGHLAITASIIWAAIIFGILLIIIIFMIVKREALFNKLNELIKKHNTPYSSDTIVQSPNKFLYRLFAFAFNLYISFTFKIRFNREVKKIEKPSIILVTHGSFIDFMYCLKFLKKSYPHVVANRMYLYHKVMGTLLKKGGVIPKSMFTVDVESARNCFKVLKMNEVLLLMPEARLATVGKYEGIQNATAKFLHRAGVNLYLLKIEGNYFAMPKWGNGARRKSVVECNLSLFKDKEELSQIDFETFKDELDQAMDYDDYKWLEKHPELHYKTKTLAEGLEGILYKCPHCGKEGVGETRGRKYRCTHCGMEAELDSRYHFVNHKPFATIQEWYDYQQETLNKEVADNENYFLESKVVLKHGSIDGKKCLRVAGEGICRLDRSGLTYIGTDDGKDVNVHFGGNEVYRLLFGVNEDFEFYVGKEIYYFMPENRHLCVKWYQCSIALKDYFKE